MNQERVFNIPLGYTWASKTANRASKPKIDVSLTQTQKKPGPNTTLCFSKHCHHIWNIQQHGGLLNQVRTLLFGVVGKDFLRCSLNYLFMDQSENAGRHSQPRTWVTSHVLHSFSCCDTLLSPWPVSDPRNTSNPVLSFLSIASLSSKFTILTVFH